jgi:hypothetical protein
MSLFVRPERDYESHRSLRVGFTDKYDLLPESKSYLLADHHDYASGITRHTITYCGLPPPLDPDEGPNPPSIKSGFSGF